MNIEEKILQSRAELTMKYLQNFFENNHLKKLEGVFSIFGKEYLKRPLENQILLFKENIFEILNFNYDRIYKSNLFPGEIYRISYEKDKLFIEYFVFDFKNKEVPKIVEKLKKWNIKNFDFLENLKLFRIKYKISLENESSFKSIKYYNPKSIDRNSHLFLKDYDDFSEVFIKSLEISNNKSGLTKDILELYEETKRFRSNFQLTYKVDDEDFENFQSLYDFLKSKYNIPNTEKLKKIPLSIMEKFFEDEFLRSEENGKIIDFILKNKTDFLSEMVNVGIWKNQKGIVETYFDASGIFDKFYASKIEEYDELDEKVKKENEKQKEENKPIIIYFARKRKGTSEYVKEFLVETFYLGKNLNIRNIVNQIEECKSFKELEFLNEKLKKIKANKIKI